MSATQGQWARGVLASIWAKGVGQGQEDRRTEEQRLQDSRMALRAKASRPVGARKASPFYGAPASLEKGISVATHPGKP